MPHGCPPSYGKKTSVGHSRVPKIHPATKRKVTPCRVFAARRCSASTFNQRSVANETVGGCGLGSESGLVDTLILTSYISFASFFPHLLPVCPGQLWLRRAPAGQRPFLREDPPLPREARRPRSSWIPPCILGGIPTIGRETLQVYVATRCVLALSFFKYL